MEPYFCILSCQLETVKIIDGDDREIHWYGTVKIDGDREQQ